MPKISKMSEFTNERKYSSRNTSNDFTYYCLFNIAVVIVLQIFGTMAIEGIIIDSDRGIGLMIVYAIILVKGFFFSFLFFFGSMQNMYPVEKLMNRYLFYYILPIYSFITLIGCLSCSFVAGLLNWRDVGEWQYTALIYIANSVFILVPFMYLSFRFIRGRIKDANEELNRVNEFYKSLQERVTTKPYEDMHSFILAKKLNTHYTSLLVKRLFNDYGKGTNKIS
jgi:hypothetical protein